MSIEQIVLLVLFLVVPLVQHLLRALGKGDAEEEPPQAERQPRRPAPPQPPPVREWQPPPIPVEEFLPDEEMLPELRQPAMEAVRYVPPLPAPPSRQWNRRGPARLGLYNRSALRHAMVLMTVLEPCRAIRPHEQK